MKLKKVCEMSEVRSPKSDVKNFRLRISDIELRTIWILGLLGLLLFPNLSHAQTDNRGTDFWVCFPQNAKHEAYAGLNFRLYITGDHAAKGVVTGPGNIRQEFSLRAGEVISIEIDTMAQVFGSDQIQKLG